jgi:hypothetical protein
MRKQAWVIVERPSEFEDEKETVFDILHGQSKVATGLRNIKSCRAIIINSRIDGERVWREDNKDGYRSELTRSFPAPRTSTKHETAEIYSDPERPAWTRYMNRYGRLRAHGYRG